MKFNSIIKLLFIIIMVFNFKISYCNVISVSGLEIDIPNNWKIVDPTEVIDATKKAKELGMMKGSKYNAIWTFKETNKWVEESNVTLYSGPNNGDTIYRNYLKKEYQKLSRDIINYFENKYKLDNIFITDKNINFNSEKDLLTVGFQVSGNGHSLYQNNAYFFTQSKICVIQAVIYFDSSYKQNRSDYDKFISSIKIHNKIQDEKESITKSIFDIAKSKYIWFIILFYLIISIITMFIESRKEKNPNIYTVLNFFPKILRMIFRTLTGQSYSNHNSNPANDTNTTKHSNTPHHDNQIHSIGIDNVLSSNELDNHLSDNVNVDDKLSENLKIDNIISDKK